MYSIKLRLFGIKSYLVQFHRMIKITINISNLLSIYDAGVQKFFYIQWSAFIFQRLIKLQESLKSIGNRIIGKF